MEKQYKIPVTIAILSAIMEIVLLFDQQLEIGYWLSYLFPCHTPEFNSFPCFGFYSIYLFLFLFIVFALSMGYILELRKRVKNNLPLKPLSMVFTIFSQLIAAGALAIIVAWIIANVFIFILK